MMTSETIPTPTSATQKVEIRARAIFGGYLIFALDVDASIAPDRRVRVALQAALKARANLSGANLSRAIGISPERTTDLLMLLDQPGKIRAYKLVTSDLRSPIHGFNAITYTIGETIEVSDANTSQNIHCAAGINVATLPWVLRNWCVGWRVLIVEFEAKDIAAIPTATDGKFRLFRCTVVGEKAIDPVALGMVRAET